MVPSDAERLAVADKLRQAVVDGLLPFDELERRLDATYAATSIDELSALVRWLPVAESRPPRLGLAKSVVAAVLAAALIFGGAVALRQDSAPRDNTTAPPRALDSDRVRDQPVIDSDASAPERATTGAAWDGELREQAAIIEVNATSRRLAIQQRSQVITYEPCGNFRAADAQSRPLQVTDLLPGDYADVAVDSAKACVATIRLVDPPSPGSCDTDDMPGIADVTWKGFNARAHSVLYLPTGDGQDTLSQRWCTPPTVSDRNGVATTLDKLQRGSTVRLTIANGFITAVSER